MSLVTAGEISAMGLLYERYKRPLYAYFLKVTCGDTNSSEDLVHTVFYRAIRYKSTFTGQGSFVKWLFSIAHNVSIDHKKKNRNIVEYKGDILQAIPLRIDDQEEKNDRNEKLATVENALKKLNDEERELVIMCKVDCLKYSDVAEILGISESNVKIRMFRAVRKLREIVINIEKCRYEKTGS